MAQGSNIQQLQRMVSYENPIFAAHWRSSAISRHHCLYRFAHKDFLTRYVQKFCLISSMDLLIVLSYLIFYESWAHWQGVQDLRGMKSGHTKNWYQMTTIPIYWFKIFQILSDSQIHRPIHKRKSVLIQ